MITLSVICLTGALLLEGCTGSTKDLRDLTKKTPTGTDEQIFIEDSVERYYHPNVMMKRGEAFFEKEEYAEALIEFNRFLEFYHNHVLAPYAAFRIGEVHMKMAKTVDRDPEPIQKAILAFQRVQKDYPGSRYEALAQEKIEECHNWLAEMHLLVGRFYYRRGSYLAAAYRFEQIMQAYPDRPVAPDALYFLAMSYHELGADDWARERLTLLAEKYPDSPAANRGKSLLAELGGPKPGTLIARQSDPAAGTDPGPAARGLSHDDVPSLPQFRSLEFPSANAIAQAFTACHLGAWC